MNHTVTRRVLPFIAAALGLGLVPAATASAHPRPPVVGHVYEPTNASDGNAIQAFDRSPDGRLTAGQLVSTGGRGTGQSLHSQGAVTQDGSLLFTVNAGSNTVSALEVTHRGLVLRDTLPTRGMRPVSVTTHDGVGYVVNQGSDTITGFRYSRAGELHALAGSTRQLTPNPSGGTTDAAQISFTPNGTALLVTEKATNRLETYPVVRGYTRRPVTAASAGTTPYGFAFTTSGYAVISEATTGSASTYQVGRYGARLVSAVVPTTQGAACWVVIRARGDIAYVVNAASGTVSSFKVGHDGRLRLFDATAATTGPGGTDAALSGDQHSLYVRMSDGSISSWSISGSGALSGLGTTSGAASVGTAGLTAD